jgi:2-amino-4-hydroxy-6-hydroxymethyldihydropteridine diphosphokinase
MKKELTPELTLILNRHVRLSFQTKKLAHSVTIGVGGNIGDVCRRIDRLLIFLKRDPMLSLHQVSPILKNPPFGFLDQEDFYNAILKVSTHLNARAFLKHLLAIEKKFGRKRSFQDAPRTLDLDMIFFDDITMEHKDLTLPHPAWYKRESVLIPLSYM